MKVTFKSKNDDGTVQLNLLDQAELAIAQIVTESSTKDPTAMKLRLNKHGIQYTLDSLYQLLWSARATYDLEACTSHKFTF